MTEPLAPITEACADKRPSGANRAARTVPIGRRADARPQLMMR
jgi:hypothetical protein